MKRFLKVPCKRWLCVQGAAVLLACTAPGLTAGDIPQTDDEKNVRNILRLYCKHYSNEDVPSYKSLFSEKARIATVFPNGELFVLSLDDFIYTQAHYFKQSQVREETFDNVIVETDGTVARAVADYTLSDDEGVSAGKDYFTLIKQDGRWKIVFLLFTDEQVS